LFADRWPFFYGWVIVAVAFLGSGLATGVGMWGPSVFVIPMTEELGWTRATFFLAFTVRGVTVGLISPFVGPVFDSRHGPRAAMIAGGVLMGVSMAGIRYIDHLWQFLLLFGVAGGIADLGSGFVISRSVVPKWFVRRRGRALGIAIAGVGLGATVFPGSVALLVNAVGWRDAWVYFGVISGAIKVTLGFFVRTRPEDVGLSPDGEFASALPTEIGEHPPSLTLQERSFTRREAFHSKSFWVLLATFTLVGFGITGFQTNWVPFLLQRNFTLASAAAGILFYGVLSGFSRPVWGWVGERIPPRFLLAGSTLFTGVSIFSFLHVTSLPLLAGYMTIAGVSMGGFLILQSLLTSNYFGREHIGAITAMMAPAAIVSTSISPLIIGALYDLKGDYVYAFTFSAVAWISAGVVALFAKPPKRASADASGAATLE
jgi:sugar phosphate permease